MAENMLSEIKASIVYLHFRFARAPKSMLASFDTNQG